MEPVQGLKIRIITEKDLPSVVEIDERITKEKGIKRPPSSQQSLLDLLRPSVLCV